uniref:Uncharacterized protein n=1 Tax=Plectus sambesii TaxID=2011161 RepID=A0A914W7Q5_9BILA
MWVFWRPVFGLIKGELGGAVAVSVGVGIHSSLEMAARFRSFVRLSSKVAVRSDDPKREAARRAVGREGIERSRLSPPVLRPLPPDTTRRFGETNALPLRSPVVSRGRSLGGRFSLLVTHFSIGRSPTIYLLFLSFTNCASFHVVSSPC